MVLLMPQQAEQENEWGNGSVLVDLKEHGGDIPVSKGNVEEYIQVVFLGSRGHGGLPTCTCQG